MAVKITYFVHGTTIDNEQERATGWKPGELSELGIKQVKELGEQVADKHFDVVFVSDLRRAADTAELAFGGKYQIIPDTRLREWNYGNLTGRPLAEIDEESKAKDEPFPNGENHHDVEKRIAEFLQFLKENYNGKHVAIVGHQAPQLALEVLLKGKTWKQALDEDWRKTKSWQPGWEYILEQVSRSS